MDELKKYDMWITENKTNPFGYKKKLFHIHKWTTIAEYWHQLGTPRKQECECGCTRYQIKI
jgi:hypothetical protein